MYDVDCSLMLERLLYFFTRVTMAEAGEREVTPGQTGELVAQGAPTELPPPEAESALNADATVAHRTTCKETEFGICARSFCWRT